MGFETRNFDGYAGDVRMGPLGVDPLAILVHLDVVPAGDGWTVPPFAAEIEDGRMYGRGMSDDKGPAAAALYAMYAMKKAGLPLKREVRLIFGCDEESGWECMKYYMAHCDMPPHRLQPRCQLSRHQHGKRASAPEPACGLRFRRPAREGNQRGRALQRDPRHRHRAGGGR